MDNENFYEVVTLATMYICHEMLGMDFIIHDGRVAKVERGNKKKNPAAGTADGLKPNTTI